jgi:DnaK suppressor protein
MNMNVHTQQANDVAHGGGVWYRLRAEREEICEAILREPQASQPEVAVRADSTLDWHRDLLQARLQKIDDALDRLMAGSYGNCTKCGRWIEDTKLDFDPAIAYCIECWPRVQTIH